MEEGQVHILEDQTSLGKAKEIVMKEVCCCQVRKNMREA